MKKFSVFCVTALDSPPVELTRRCGTGALYEDVPVPVPEQINLFTTGNWPGPTDIEVTLSYKGHSVNLGTLSQKTRSLYWERDVSDLPPVMVSPGEKGAAMLVLETRTELATMETNLDDSQTDGSTNGQQLRDQNENTPQVVDDANSTPERMQKKKRPSSFNKQDKTPTGPSSAKKQKTQKLSSRILSPTQENKHGTTGILTPNESNKCENSKIVTPKQERKSEDTKKSAPKLKSKPVSDEATKKRTPKQETKTRMRTPKQEKAGEMEKATEVKTPKGSKSGTENSGKTKTRIQDKKLMKDRCKSLTKNNHKQNNADSEGNLTQQGNGPAGTDNQASHLPSLEQTAALDTHSKELSDRLRVDNEPSPVTPTVASICGDRKVASCKDLTTRAARPSSRWGHSLCFVNKNLSVLIGGQGNKQQLSRDGVWTLDTETRRWRNPATQSEGLKPDSRMGHTATYDPMVRCIYVFGGSKNTRWFHDVHMLDIDEWKWQLIKVSGKAPTRAYHSATLYRHELWIFGGVYPRTDPQPDGCSNEIHIFSPVMESWYDPIVQGEKPIPRSGHSATLLDDQLVVFGGWDAPISYQDLHILDMSIVEWTQPEFSGTPPKPRSWHASCALTGKRVLIHGGYDGNLALEDTHIFDLGTMAWMQILMENRPSPRVGHKCLCMPYRHDNGDEDEVIIFGGGDNDGGYFDDLISVYVPFLPAHMEAT